MTIFSHITFAVTKNTVCIRYFPLVAIAIFSFFFFFLENNKKNVYKYILYGLVNNVCFVCIAIMCPLIADFPLLYQPFFVK